MGEDTSVTPVRRATGSGEEMDLVVDGVESPRLCIEFEGGPESIARARQATGAFLDQLVKTASPGRASAYGDVLLVVSELATNAVRHAPGGFRLEIGVRSREVLVTVRDSSRMVPQARAGDFAGGGGFGWPLVLRVSLSADARPLPDGKEIHVILPW